MTEQALREQICHIGQLMYKNRYIDSTAGNISARLSDDRILTTPSGLAKGFMSPEHLIIVDLDGQRVDAPNALNSDLRPTSEILMHLECYKQRSDVYGVVHAHPPTAVALSICGYDFKQCVIPEMILLLGLVPTTPYATPSSAENRDAISDLINDHDAIMLAHHGSLTVAKDVWSAYMLLESLEHSATILHKVEQLGRNQILPLHQVEKLLDQRENLGLLRPNDRKNFRSIYGK